MTLQGDVEAVVEDERVRFVFDVTNDGEDAEELTFRDAGKADFVVERADASEEHWRWSEGRMFAQVIETERLAPGESSRYEGEWRSPDTGTYVARATLRAHDRDLEATCEFAVEE